MLQNMTGIPSPHDTAGFSTPGGATAPGVTGVTPAAPGMGAVDHGGCWLELGKSAENL